MITHAIPLTTFGVRAGSLMCFSLDWRGVLCLSRADDLEICMDTDTDADADTTIGIGVRRCLLFLR